MIAAIVILSLLCCWLVRALLRSYRREQFYRSAAEELCRLLSEETEAMRRSVVCLMESEAEVARLRRLRSEVVQSRN